MNQVAKECRAVLSRFPNAKEYMALPELESNDCAVAIQKIVLEHEGWDRDEAASEPAET